MNRKQKQMGLLNSLFVNFCPISRARKAKEMDPLFMKSQTRIDCLVWKGLLNVRDIAEFTTPLGGPEVLREGADITLVTYGSCCGMALKVADQLLNVGIEIEVIDMQSLLPFDLHGTILESLKRTEVN